MTRHLSAAALGMLLAACTHGHPPSEAPPRAVLPPPPSATVQGPGPGEAVPRSLDQMLAGKIAGVTVSPAAGGGIVVRMTGGGNSAFSGQDPLYLVDGTEVQTVNGALPWLNPADIESITALKNPADVGVYGVRGANGVILIKTKKGGRPK